MLKLLVLKRKFTRGTDSGIKQKKKNRDVRIGEEKALFSFFLFCPFFFLYNTLNAIRFFFFSLFLFLIEVKKRRRKKSVIQYEVCFYGNSLKFFLLTMCYKSSISFKKSDVCDLHID